MFYDSVENKHGLRHDPFKQLVVPRPIGWISTISTDGVVNLAPYSFFNAVGDNPHYVMFSSSGRKDSLVNAEQTGEFVCSLATYELRDQMNTSSADVGSGVDEFKLSGLTAAASHFVKPPRVAESPAALECRYHTTVVLPGAPGSNKPANAIVIGQVVGIYIDDKLITDGLVDIGAAQPISRLGYFDYGVLRSEAIFSILRPQVADDDTLVLPKAAE